MKTPKKAIARFSFGSVFGLFLAVIFWSFSVYFHADLAPAYTIAGILIVSISFGAMATFTSIDKLMELMENLPSI